MRTNSSTLSSIAYDGINVKLSYMNRHGYDSTNEFGNVRTKEPFSFSGFWFLKRQMIQTMRQQMI